MNKINSSCRVCIETENYFPLTYIQKVIMIDMSHEHECLIILFGFNVQFVSNLIYLYSYILAVSWYVLRVDFMCPKS